MTDRLNVLLAGAWVDTIKKFMIPEFMEQSEEWKEIHIYPELISRLDKAIQMLERIDLLE